MLNNSLHKTAIKFLKFLSVCHTSLFEIQDNVTNQCYPYSSSDGQTDRLKSSLKRRSESLTEDQISPGKYWNFSNIIEYSSDYGDLELHSIRSLGEEEKLLSSKLMINFVRVSI